MNTIEGNKIIAIFMGAHENHQDRWYNVRKGDNGYRMAKDFEYHSSWDWLIPAHNKARELFLNLPKEIRRDFLQSYKTYIESHGFHNFFSTFENQYTISSCWHKMVDFAKWYNDLSINKVNI